MAALVIATGRAKGPRAVRAALLDGARDLGARGRDARRRSASCSLGAGAQSGRTALADLDRY